MKFGGTAVVVLFVGMSPATAMTTRSVTGFADEYILRFRITMLPVFPKDPRYGTKMPVRVKVHFPF